MIQGGQYLCEDDEVDVMNVKRTFSKKIISEQTFVAGIVRVEAHDMLQTSVFSLGSLFFGYCKK
jgi:hypothetical protein